LSGDAGDVAEPTMLGFAWTPRTIHPAMRSLPGDLWCVRDAFSALMQWETGSENWLRFIEAPDGPADMERLIGHLGLVAYDPEYPDHVEPLSQALDRPGITCYKFHRMRMEHCMYQPHLRHLIPLPPEYLAADPNPELFQVIVDLRQPPHAAACWACP
jgi:hypothetical protein